MPQSNKTIVDKKLQELNSEAEEREARRHALKAGFPYLDIKTAPMNIEALALISEEEALEAKAAAIEIKSQGKEVAVVCLDPHLPALQAAVQKLKAKSYTASLFVVSLSSLKHIWDFYKFVPKGSMGITGSVNIEEKKIIELQHTLVSLPSIKEALEAVNTIKSDTSELLEIILAGALANRASDIHLEPEEEHIKLRLRIDGSLYDVFTALEKGVYLYLLSRIKLLSGLKLNVHTEPQDGRYAIKFSHKEIEVRVAVAPAEYGEVVVMRLLDPETIGLTLQELGLRADDLEIVEQELKKPNGMILNTGPTGSGKTTTLYAFLKHKKSSEIKIITIEDPIEYQLEGIEQTQVDEEGGYTFANGLKSLMRQDPDVILVGEIRDKETAEIGIQSALTGHLVFSTVHANEAAGAIPRLLDLDVRPSSIGPAINLIIGQRLVRRLCEKCKGKDTPSDELKKKIKKVLERLPERVDKGEFKALEIYKAAGCDVCNHLGYKGRIAIYEFLPIGPELEEMITKESNEASIQKFAVRNSMVTMQEDGILKTIAGVTTLEEVEDVTGPISW
mgnify:CR=1 FL=1